MQNIADGIESALLPHLLENDYGCFRWQRINSRFQHAPKFRLKFLRSCSVLGLKIPLRNEIILTFESTGAAPHRCLRMFWRIHSLSDRTFCRDVVFETDLDITEAVQEFLS
jgi:hypothetical protein